MRYVEQTTRNPSPSNQMRSHADLLLHTFLEGNKLSYGKGILLNENSFITFLLTLNLFMLIMRQNMLVHKLSHGCLFYILFCCYNQRVKSKIRYSRTLRMLMASTCSMLTCRTADHHSLLSVYSISESLLTLYHVME